ncbi:MAG: hypothetical protein V1647_02755, partial [Pseudomonadota bacterium]
ILSGACNTIVKGIEAAIDDSIYKRLFITGGGAEFFKSLSSKEFVYIEDLIFLGMKSIYNREKKQ